ncbi:MAG: hypothetical protein N3D11_10590 [Candidatus Sumerlaeia bacterium]|nr:hypothetical protein [Candidatus Sumerlaeia bacterium]
MGSNATKILIWEIAGDGQVRERFQKRYALRLDDVFRTGRIEPPTVVRLTETFAEIAALCRQHGVEAERAVATEAFRSAANAREVADAIALETGIEIAIISAEEEARLVAEGVLLDRPVQGSAFLIFDIGGGSAQVSRVDRSAGGNTAATETFSMPLGAVRLREMFVRGDPISPADYEALQEHVRAALTVGLAKLNGQWAPCAVGCGGGVRFLHMMCGIHGGALGQDQPVRYHQLEHLCQTIWPMSVSALMRNFGIDRERAEIIVPGAVVAVNLMKHLHVNDLRPSRRGLRDGLLAEFMRHCRTRSSN